MRAGIALGSNLGDRASHLQHAVNALRAIASPGAPFLISRVYETAPVDCPSGSGPFLNAAVEIGCALAPGELLDALAEIEARLGRPAARAANAPRPIDLDILYCDDIALTLPNLVIPHPRLASRRFVLDPLADIVPDRILPGQARSIIEIQTALAASDCEEIKPSRVVLR